jgi:hypothetical protein
MLQAMISEESKSEGRQINEEQNCQQEQTDQQVTAISTLPSFNSGQLASSNRLILNKDLLEQLRRRKKKMNIAN